MPKSRRGVPTAGLGCAATFSFNVRIVAAGAMVHGSTPPAVDGFPARTAHIHANPFVVTKVNGVELVPIGMMPLVEMYKS